MEACKLNAMRLLELLAVLQEDAGIKTKLLEAQCNTLQASLALCRRGCMENDEEPEETITTTVSQTETALAQALRRARAIRQAMDAAVDPPPSAPILAPAPTKSSGKQKIALPRNMKAKLKEIDDTTMLWKAKDAPPIAACTKLTQILAQRDSSNTSVAVRMSYRDQLNRITQAYSCILHVLETKCQDSNYASVDTTPRLPTIFPVWYRLNKIKQILAALNNELAVCLERIPPRPVLSERASKRSLAFLKAIHKKPLSTFDNSPLRASSDMSLDSIYEKLQSAWDNTHQEAYTTCSEQILYEEVCKSLVPPLQQLSDSENASTDVLRLLRLVHSLTCCDGLEIHSIVSTR